MLTETDMIRIMAEKYALAESVSEEYIDNESQDEPENIYQFEKLGFDMPYTGDRQTTEMN